MLVTSGYNLSVKLKRPVRADGSPIPWFNYNAVDFLEDRLTKDLRVFEYGSGNSTQFFAPRVTKVVSLERDPYWYNYGKENMPDNVELVLYDKDAGVEYCDVASRRAKQFDVIVIDADDRIECMRTAVDALSARGVIILDDAEREQYRPGVDHLLARGFRELPFKGLKPGGIRAYGTTIFYRPDNCLAI